MLLYSISIRMFKTKYVIDIFVSHTATRGGAMLIVVGGDAPTKFLWIHDIYRKKGQIVGIVKNKCFERFFDFEQK